MVDTPLQVVGHQEVPHAVEFTRDPAPTLHPRLRARVFTFTALCARYGVSRETGYAVLARYRREGRASLEEHSRRPHHSPRQTPDGVIEQLLEARRRHPT